MVREISQTYGLNNQQFYGSSLRPKVSGFNAAYPRANNRYVGDEEEDLEDEELGEEDVETNGVRMIGKDTYDDEDDGEDEDEDEDEDEVDSYDEEEEDSDEHYDGKASNGKAEDVGFGRPRKKRKLRTLISNYEFAPRVPTPCVQKVSVSQPSSGGQNSVGDWTEKETFALLDAWGERFLRLGRKSLRSDEWQEVAEKVSQETNSERTDAQCRNRLDTLKKKYKKERMKLTVGGNGGGSKWPFYRKMDMLLSSPQQQTGLSCGIDSGEYVFMNPKVYLNHANGLDEMRDSPGNSDSLRDEEEDDSDGPPTGNKNKRRRVGGSSAQLLADSIQKFSNIYEKIESNKRKQMLELENMRMDFQRQLEMQRREILERAQTEIAKIRRGNDDENDLSAENLSG